MATRALQPTITRSLGFSWSRVGIYFILTLGAFIAIFPFWHMVATSLKTYGSVITGTFWPWPPLGTEPLQWQNYKDAIEAVGWDKQWNMYLFFRYALNSIIISVVIVSGVMITSVLAAYAFAQMDLPGKNFLFLLLYTVIGTFKAFNHIYIMTQGGPGDATKTASLFIFEQMYQYNRYGYSAALSFILFSVILVVTILQNRFASRSVVYA